ncbi:uncharacterized protein METZ01_LOCUS124949 [marine metagenome]|uniref:DNA-directed RNA polymerase n=1 Tax=marine metagenome TaxID=408172 RepID=A0A381Y547_9ZZZZ
MPLSDEQSELIGSYFSRNYEQGERVEIPPDMPDDPYGWFLEQPVIQLDRFPLLEVRYSPDKTPPRILLREEEDFLSKSIEDAKANSSPITLLQDIYGPMQLDGRILSPSHHEFKIWLQYKVEKVARGEGSPRFLASREEGGNHERGIALDKWDDLTDIVYELLNDKLLMQDGILEVRQLKLIDKITDRRELEESWGYEESYELEEGYGNSTRKICQVVVQSLISKSIIRPPPAGEEYDVLRKNDSLEISLPGITFLDDASKRIASRINGLIQEAQRLHKIEPPKDSEYFRLSEKEEEAFQTIISNGFGSRQGSERLKNSPPEKVTLHNSMKLSYNILSLMIERGFLERRLMDWEDLRAHFSNQEDSKAPRNKKHSPPHLLVFSDDLKKNQIGCSGFSDYKKNKLHPIYRWLSIERDRWMYCHPKRHSHLQSGWEGGLLSDSEIISNHSDYEDFETPRCRPSEESVFALSSLESTQWEINLDFVEALFDAEIDDNNTHLEGGIRGKIDSIFKLRPKAIFKPTFFLPDDDLSQEDVARKNEERKTTLDWVKRIIEHNANVFWHSWAFDFRGRVYPRCRTLSPQGDDLDRALIRFKEWKPLGERGIFWLHVHVHNLFQGRPNSNWEPPQKRQSFEDRDLWVKDNLEELRRIANNPEGNIDVLGLNKFSGGKSEAFQRLALVIELDRVWNEYDSKGSWDKVHSGQPVHLDATCSGYQHVAALLRNQTLARLVNIVPTGGIEDLYSEVSNLAKKSTLADSDQAVQAASQLRVFLQENFSDDIPSKWKERLFSRDLAKQMTINKIYGSSKFEKCFEGRRGEGPPMWVRHPKSEERLEQERAELDAIPDEIKDYFSKYESLEPPYYRGYWKWSWFVNAVKRRGGTKAEAESYRDLIREWSWEAAWHPESPLYKAIMKGAEDLVTNLFEGNVILQKEMVSPIVETYLRALNEVTEGVYEMFNESLQDLVVPDATFYESAIRWNLPDGFEVRNYYIKHMDGAKSKQGSPTHVSSTYSKLRPSWYKPNSKFSILERIEEVLGKKLEKLRDELKKPNKKTGKNSPQWDSTRVEMELREIDPKNVNRDLDEVRRVLAWRDYSLTRFSDDESDRINGPKAKRSITPHLVHSLDAYHIRSVIRRMSEPEGLLDFWAVHDSFGTHPSRVDEMVDAVRECFYEMYSEMDINAWMKRMAPDQFEPVETGDLDPQEFLASEYMIN